MNFYDMTGDAQAIFVLAWLLMAVGVVMSLVMLVKYLRRKHGDKTSATSMKTAIFLVLIVPIFLLLVFGSFRVNEIQKENSKRYDAAEDAIFQMVESKGYQLSRQPNSIDGGLLWLSTGVRGCEFVMTFGRHPDGSYYMDESSLSPVGASLGCPGKPLRTKKF